MDPDASQLAIQHELRDFNLPTPGISVGVVDTLAYVQPEMATAILQKKIWTTFLIAPLRIAHE